MTCAPLEQAMLCLNMGGANDLKSEIRKSERTMSDAQNEFSKVQAKADVLSSCTPTVSVGVTFILLSKCAQSWGMCQCQYDSKSDTYSREEDQQSSR